MTFSESPSPSLAASPWHPAWAWALGALVLATGGVAFALPIMDGDLWWQMAYGRDMLANGTLIPDHTLYSWAPIDDLGDHIYCAWISEMLLYGLYRVGDLPALFALRYLVMAFVVAIPWLAARRNGVARHPLTYLILLLALLMCHSRGNIKPNLLSIAFMAAVVGTYFAFRDAGGRGGRLCYILPVLMLVWVNSHGAWIFGMAFLVLACAGELLNYWFSRSEALPSAALRHLFASGLLCVVAVHVTPYHARYPLALAQGLVGQEVNQLRAINEYQPIFSEAVDSFHYAEYLGGALVLLGLCYAAKRQKTLNWALILSNVFFVYMYCFMIRATSFYAPVFALTSIHWLAEARPWLRAPSKSLRVAFGALSVFAVIAIGGQLAHQRLMMPPARGWLGFGISSASPVREADFIDECLPDARIGNTYVTGGYLLWRLAPERKVFIDPRHFPYRSWYEEYRDLELARKGIGGFVQKNRADVWCIDHRRRKCVEWFVDSDAWKAVYCGDAAVLFVRADGPYREMPLQHADALARIKNPGIAHAAVEHAIYLDDFEAADKALRSLHALRYMRHVPEAHLTLHRRLISRQMYADEWERALATAERALTVSPRDRKLLFRAGTLAHHIAQQSPGRPATLQTKWKAYLSAYLEEIEGEELRGMDAMCREQARRLLGTEPTK